MISLNSSKSTWAGVAEAADPFSPSADAAAAAMGLLVTGVAERACLSGGCTSVRGELTEGERNLTQHNPERRCKTLKSFLNFDLVTEDNAMLCSLAHPVRRASCLNRSLSLQSTHNVESKSNV